MIEIVVMACADDQIIEPEDVWGKMLLVHVAKHLGARKLSFEKCALICIKCASRSGLDKKASGR